MFLNNITHGWLGEIPSRWELKRMKHIFYISKNISDSPDEEDVLSLTFGGIIKRDISKNEGQLPESYKGYSKIYPDDIVMNPMDLKSGWIDKSEFEGIISPSYYVLKPYSSSVDIQYFTYQFQRHYRERIFFPFGHGVSYDYRWGLGKETLLNFPVISPPFSEQKQISQFLDRKTQKLDELIEKTEQKIELLKEKRTSLINHCVTKGLNPNVEMKDSGVEWIGEIPSGWDIKKVSWISSLVTQGGNPNYSLGQESDEYRVLKTKSLYDDVIYYNDSDKISEETFLGEPKSKLLKGDFLISIVGKGSIGKTNVFNPSDDNNYIYSRSLGCIRFKEIVNVYFSKYIFQSTRGKEIIDLGIKGSTGQEVVQTTYLKELRVQVPPLPEQQQIIEYLDEQIQKIDTTIEKETKRIVLLKEYRQSLISEVVTGKIDVRNEVVA